jgi:hypothetical protein
MPTKALPLQSFVALRDLLDPTMVSKNHEQACNLSWL